MVAHLISYFIHVGNSPNAFAAKRDKGRIAAIRSLFHHDGDGKLVREPQPINHSDARGVQLHPVMFSPRQTWRGVVHFGKNSATPPGPLGPNLARGRNGDMREAGTRGESGDSEARDTPVLKIMN